MAVGQILLSSFVVAWGASTWNYDMPQNWYKEFPDCGGQQQSPIDINTSSVQVKGGLSNFEPFLHWTEATNLTLENTGHGLKVKADSKLGQLKIAEKKETYNVLQFHLHSPSEHTVDGKLLDYELHIVHQMQGKTGLDGLLVVGVLFSQGFEENSLIKTMLDGAPQSKGATKQISSAVNLKNELKSVMNSGFYRYEGSLTTPPCSETVNWFVMKGTMSVTQAQIDAFKQLEGVADPANNRPVQPLYGRQVLENTLLGCPSHALGGRRLASWDYVAPQCWAQSYDKCGGSSQSPINIEKTTLSANGSETLQSSANYKSLDNMKLINTGHGFQVNGNFGSLTIGSDIYNVIQFHWHCPSEHAIDGKLFACELHTVHRKDGTSGLDDLLVVGLMFKIGQENAHFKAWGANNKDLQQENSITGSVDLNGLLAPALNGSFYHYSGSLTTPPCDETVKWFVLDTPAEMSQEQLDTYNSYFPDPSNNRPLQLRNGRSLVKNQFTLTQVTLAPNTTAACAQEMHDGKWDYALPQCWPGVCQTGEKQSPININTTGHFSSVGGQKMMQFQKYSSATGSLTNDGHGLKIAPKNGESFGHIMMGTDKYNVLQFHVHCPSEHTLNGQESDCELHIVHQKDQATGLNDLLVVGILYNMGADEDALLKKMGLGGEAPQKGDAAINVQVNLSASEYGVAQASDFFRYEGSLTTPPCSETVAWHVVQQSRSVSLAQFNHFKMIFGNPMNNRPVQLLNGRAIFKNSQIGSLDSGVQGEGLSHAVHSHGCWLLAVMFTLPLALF